MSKARLRNMPFQGDATLAIRNGLGNSDFTSNVLIATRDNVSTSAFEDVWGGAAATRTILTANQTFEIVSDSADDNVAGTGARTVLVAGVDEDYTQTQEVVLMNGVTPVTLAAQYTFINRIVVFSAGSGRGNAGTITLTETGGSTEQAIMSPGIGLNHDGIYTVPKNFHATFTAFSYSAATNKDLSFRNKLSPLSPDVDLVSQASEVVGGALSYVAPIRLSAPPRTTFVIQAQASGANTTATFGAELILRRLF